MSSLLVPGDLQAVVIGIHLMIDDLHSSQAIFGRNASTSLQRSSVLDLRVGIIAATDPAVLLEECANSDVVDLVKVIVVVAQIIRLAANIGNFQHAFPRQALRNGETVILCPRLLVVFRIQDRGSARST